VSKPRYWWWASVRAAIKQYPALARKKADLQAMPMTKAVKSIKGADGKLADLYATPGKGSGNGRPVERFALAELPPQEERVLQAVRTAIEATELGRDGAEHMALLRDYHWGGHGLQAAAIRNHVDYRTARRWNAAFTNRVARGLGYLPGGRE
jgi:hypothetical protein